MAPHPRPCACLLVALLVAVPQGASAIESGGGAGVEPGDAHEPAAGGQPASSDELRLRESSAWGDGGAGARRSRAVQRAGGPTEFFEDTPGSYSYEHERERMTRSGLETISRAYAVSRVEDPATGGVGTFEYDDWGNLVHATVAPATGPPRTLELEWDALNRLVHASRCELGRCTNLAFGYDYAGARVFKRVEGSWEGEASGAACDNRGYPLEDRLYEHTSIYVDATTEVRGCRLTHFVLAGGRRVARVVDESPLPFVDPDNGLDPYTFFYHPDHLGSTSVVTDADTGDVVNHVTYLPYGSVDEEYTDPSRGDFSSDYKYTDKELDEEIGLVYFGARYYWPQLGRWVSADPYFAGFPERGLRRPRELNVYGFVLGNPYYYTDPQGEATALATWTTPVGYGVCMLDSPAPGPADAVGLAIVNLGLIIDWASGALEQEDWRRRTEAWAEADKLNAAMSEAKDEAEEENAEEEEGWTEDVESVDEGIYEFPDQKEDGDYVGQSENVPERLKQHKNKGKHKEGTARAKPVKGGKTDREVAEHERIQQKTGGKPARKSTEVTNKRDPIGPKRQYLLKKE